MLTASRIARYLEASSGSRYSTFADFMDLEDVKKLIRKRLFGVEQGALSFLTDHGAALTKIDPALIT